MNYIINTERKTIEFLENVKIEDVIAFLSNYKDYVLVSHVQFVDRVVTTPPIFPSYPFFPYVPNEPFRVWCNG